MVYNSGIIFISSMGLSITVMDIVVVLFILILGFVGLAKGFSGIFFSLFGTIAVIVGAVLLSSDVGGWLMGPCGHLVQDPMTSWVAGLGAGNETISSVFTSVNNWADPETRNTLMPLVLTAMGIPATLAGIINDTGLFNSVFSNFGEAALVDVLPHAGAQMAMTVIAFILLLIVFGIIVAILRRIFEKLISIRVFGSINKLFGFFLGLAEGYLIISIILVVVAFIPADGFMAPIYGQIEASVVTKFLVSNNWIGNWLISSFVPSVAALF